MVARTDCSIDNGEGDVHNVIRARLSLHRGVEVREVEFKRQARTHCSIDGGDDDVHSMNRAKWSLH